MALQVAERIVEIPEGLNTQRERLSPAGCRQGVAGELLKIGSRKWNNRRIPRRIGGLTMQPGFFDLEDRYTKLEQLGDPLPKLTEVVDWEGFRPVLEKVYQKTRKSNAGRKPFDVVLMFKVLVLQHFYNLADEVLTSLTVRAGQMLGPRLDLHRVVERGFQKRYFYTLCVFFLSCAGLFNTLILRQRRRAISISCPAR